MRVIVVDPNRNDVLTTRRVLESHGHSVQTFADTKEAFPSMVDGHADVAVVEWNLGMTSGAELVHHVRAAERNEYLYIIALLDRDSTVPLDSIFAAGADDFVRKPTNAVELLERIHGVDRLRRVAHLIVDREALRRALPTPTTQGIVRLDAWARLVELTRSSLGDFASLPLRVAAPGTIVRPELSAAIPFSLPSQSAEIRFFVEADRRSLEVLGASIFGEPVTSEAAITDLLLEMANQIGGAFMRGAVEENVSLTTGLPVAVAPTDVSSALGYAETYKRVVLELAEPKVTVRITTTIRTRQNVRVPVTRLREGMIVVGDVHSPSGALLVRGGTRITSSACARLAELLGASSMVEVADAA